MSTSPVTVDQIQALYVAYFNRPADVQGLQFYQNAAANGATLAQIAVGFSNSPEYLSQFPVTASSPANTVTYAAITQLYQNLFNRTPALAEVQFWQNAANNGQVTLSGLALALFNGAQNSVGGSQDATIVANKLIAAEAFTGSLTTTAAALGYSGDAANAVLKAWLSTVSDDPATLNAATDPATLAAESTAATAASTTANAITVTLPTGVTTLAGNTFNGIISHDSTLNTFTAFDHLVGGTGNNNIVNLSSDGTAAPTGVTLTNIQTVNINALGDQSISAVASGTWSGVTALNITQSAGVVAPSNAAANSATVSVNVPGAAALSDTGVVVGVSHTGTVAEFSGLTIDGGSAITVTAAGSDASDSGAGAVAIGDVLIGGGTEPTGVVSLSITESLTVGGSASGNIEVDGGTDVTITSKTNDGIALTAATGTVTGGKASTITVTDATGAVVVNAITNISSVATIATFADAVSVTGGASIVVNETVTATQSATGVSSITEGAVSITGDNTTASVTVNQAAVATGALAQAAAAAIVGVTGVAAVAAGPGVQGVTAVTAVNAGNSAAAIAAAAGTATVTADAAVTIVDGSTAGNTIKNVTLSNFLSGSFTGTALTNLSLSGTGGTFAIVNAAAAPTNTTLALAVNGLSGATLDDSAHNEITTLNIATGASKSSLSVVDSGLTTVNVSGSSVLTLGGIASLTKLAVTGAAGLTDSSLAARGAALAFTTTSSGVITVTLDDTTQTFVGASGQDVISLAGDATKAITGGTASTNEVILTSSMLANSTNYTAANFTKNVTGFTTLGVADGTATDANIYDMHGVFTGYNTIDLRTTMTAAQTFTGVATGTNLAIDVAETNVSYVLFNASSTASVNVALNLPSTATGIIVGTLSLNDSNGDGVATANITSNAKSAATAAGVANTITTLADTSLTSLTISGNAALNVGTISLGQPGQATPVGVASFSITNNSVASTTTPNAPLVSTINLLNDDTLGTLSFAGSNGVTINTLNDNTAVNLSIANTGKGVATINTLATDASGGHTIHNGLSNLTFSGSGVVDIVNLQLVSNTAALTFNNTGTATDIITGISDGTTLATTTSVTVQGNIVIGTNAGLPGTPVAFASTSGVTFAAGTDNAHISIALTGALTGNVDNITVGTANNNIIDTAGAGASGGIVNVTVGSGANLINVSSNLTTNAAAFNITLGAHTTTATTYDSIFTSQVGATAGFGVNTVITGAVAGDLLTLKDASVLTVATLTAGNLATLAASTTVAQALATAHTLVASAHEAVAFTFGGNTYIVEDTVAATAATTSSVIELVGVHSVTAGTGLGQLHIA